MNDTSRYMTATGLKLRLGATEKCVVIAVLFIGLILGFARLATNTTSSDDTAGMTHSPMPRAVVQASH